MSHTTRPGKPEDRDRILSLLPRLADYELPDRRTSEMFWSDDAELVRSWAGGGAPDTHIRVAVDDADVAVAVGIITIGPDKFSREPCAHLEVIVVAPEADGQGLGRILIDELCGLSIELGATIMSLHVLGQNERARHIYRQLGFSEEMIRAVKFLDP